MLRRVGIRGGEGGSKAEKGATLWGVAGGVKLFFPLWGTEETEVNNA